MASAGNRAVAILVGAVTVGAVALLATTSHEVGAAFSNHPGAAVGFLLLTVGLQAASLTGFGSSISVAGIGMIATGMVLGVGPAVLFAIVASLVHALKKRPAPHKAAFNAGAFVLAAGAAAAFYQAIEGPTTGRLGQLLIAEGAACVFVIVNLGLLTLAMSAAERAQPFRIWRQRLAWLMPHYLAFGPLAFVAMLAEQRFGPVGLLVGAAAPVGLTILLGYSLARVRSAQPNLQLS